MKLKGNKSKATVCKRKKKEGMNTCIESKLIIRSSLVEFSEFDYLGSVVCKHRSVEREEREREEGTGTPGAYDY